MKKRVGTHKEEVRRLIFQYHRAIAYLEEKEEGLVRRIQILENLIPTVLIWYMWKVGRSKDVQFSQWTEGEAINKLHHLETVLKELQTADGILKKEELSIRKRIEELEEYLNEDPFENICVKDSSKLSLSKYKDKALVNTKMKKINEKRLQFVDFLEDSGRDWQKTCEDLVNEVNSLRDIIDNSNIKLEESAMKIKGVESSVKKDYVVKKKLNDLENKANLLYKDVIEQEKNSLAREENLNEKVFSMVEDAMDEIHSLKGELRDSQREKRTENQAPRDVGYKKPIHTITEEVEEEEAEISLGEETSPVAFPQSSERRLSPLVLNYKVKDFEKDTTPIKQILNAPPPNSGLSKEILLEGQTTSSYPDKYVDKPGLVEVDTTTNIQLPPNAQVSRLQNGELIMNIPSRQSSGFTASFSDISANSSFPIAKNNPNKSKHSLENVGGTYTDSLKPHFTSEEDLPESFFETCESVVGSSVPVEKTLVLDTSHSQLSTSSSLANISPVVSTSHVVPSIATISKTPRHDIPLPGSHSSQVPSGLKIVSSKESVSKSSHQMQLLERYYLSQTLSPTPAEVEPLNHVSESEPLQSPIPTKTAPTRLPAYKTALDKIKSSGTLQPPIAGVASEAVALISLRLSDAAIPEPTSQRTTTVDSITPSPQSYVHDSDTPQPPLSRSVPQLKQALPAISSTSSPLPEMEPLRTPVSKTSSIQESGLDKLGPHPQLSNAFPQTVISSSIPSKDEFRKKRTSIGIEQNDFKSPHVQTDLTTSKTTKPLQPKRTSTAIIPDVEFSETTSKIETAVSKASYKTTGAIENSTYNLLYESDSAYKSVPHPLEMSTATPKSEVKYEFEEQTPETQEDSFSFISRRSEQSQEDPAVLKINLGKTEGEAIAAEPYEVPNTDGDLPSSPELLLEQKGPSNLASQPNRDNLSNVPVQSNCRVKDHLIKSLADHLREQGHGNMWSGGKLLSTLSKDPVKTYDFDRHLLAKYLKGEDPKDMAASLRSDPAYSNTNQLNVKALRKLDESSLLIKWGPPPPENVVGFQIFIDGEFVYWVHSPTRNIALLQPVDFSKNLEIAVCPLDSKGNILSRSAVTYIPE